MATQPMPICAVFVTKTVCVYPGKSETDNLVCSSVQICFIADAVLSPVPREHDLRHGEDDDADETPGADSR